MSHYKRIHARRVFFYLMTVIAMLSTSLGVASNAHAASDQQQAGAFALVFVSRQIPKNGSLYYPSGGLLPGTGPFSRFTVAAPGKLLVREANGTIRTLIDGSNPTAASLNLIDVNAPDVSYDGTKILFAGIPAGSYPTETIPNPGAWRIYVINVNGTGLRQLTFSDRNIDLSQFGPVAPFLTKYDDTDPAWLPDGRIVFSSTRWPSFAMYGAAHTTNLFVMNGDGTGMHRITSERNGADRPLVDPLTGKIVYSRWWRNFRVATDSMQTITSPIGFISKDGLCAVNHSNKECTEVGGIFNLDRNAWHLATINPDGTDLAQFAGVSNSKDVGEQLNFGYGGSFAPDGSLYANFFPMMNMTEAAGFGGIRQFKPGINIFKSIIGVTVRFGSTQQLVSNNPPSHAVIVGNYAAEPDVLPDGNLVISWAKDTAQDYGLYTINPNGGNLTLLYDNPGTTETRARAIRPRSLPPVIPDKVTKFASQLPPRPEGPYDIDGTFTFQALNVYFNAPVDTNIINSIPVGSANSIRFFTDHQRAAQNGSNEEVDFPILLQEAVINPNGSVTMNMPANVPLFEQIRSSQSAGYKVPLTSGKMFPSSAPGAAHVAGENYGHPGEVVQCVGCHAGHTLIEVPTNPADAQWTNLAPGATTTASSIAPFTNIYGLADRRVRMAVPAPSFQKFWRADAGQNPNTQWTQLSFAVPVTVRTVRLWDIPASDFDINVLQATVRLFSDAAGTIEVANSQTGVLSENGTDVAFNNVLARVVRVELNSVTGPQAGLAEVEVIARGEAPDATGPATVPTFTPSLPPAGTATNTFTPTPAISGPFVSTEVNPASFNIGETGLVSVNLNNIPVDGYKSAEFTCTYDAGFVEKSNIVGTNLFGTDPVVAIHDQQPGAFIVAMAGTNSNRATTGGPAFTFSIKGLQAGQSAIQCSARVSKGDNVPIDIPSIGTSVTIPGIGTTPTPGEIPESSPSSTPEPTTSAPLESPTPIPSMDGSINGQVIASKAVTVSLIDANNVPITSVVANPDGTFSLTALAGNYTLLATASGFLSHRGTVTITAGNSIELPTASMLAGDVDGNNTIDQFDALTIGMSYTTSVPAAADLNNDSVIDFLDLELLAENYRKTGPSVWE